MYYTVTLSNEDNYLGHKFEYGNEEHFVLSDEQREKLVKLCIGGFRSTKSINRKISSYKLKHIAEDVLGFYVPNCDMKRAMVNAGFYADPLSLDYINWFFNIAGSSPLLRWNRSSSIKSVHEV